MPSIEVKTDFIHFDNFGLSHEPESCHCPECVEGFRKFLRSKYSAEERRGVSASKMSTS